MHINDYLELVQSSEQQLAKAFSRVARNHQDEPDIYYMCLMLALWSIEHARDVKSLKEKYARFAPITNEPGRSGQAHVNDMHNGETTLLGDLHDLWLLTKEIEICWNILLQAAKANQDEELETACDSMAKETKRQSEWLIARVKQAAPKILADATE
jgi:hypothetical protein